jgi:hypothetical protein
MAKKRERSTVSLSLNKALCAEIAAEIVGTHYRSAAEFFNYYGRRGLEELRKQKAG